MDTANHNVDFSSLPVLVTGGTGSFGQAFVYRLLALNCPRIVIFSRDEAKQAAMAHDLEAYADRLRFFIGDVRDRDRLRRAMQDIDTVIHAAALKRVDSAEYNPSEVVYTNVYGSQNVIEMALENNVRRVIGLSSDKACDPVTLYGRTKALMESVFCRANVYAGKRRTRFACTRYGNVLGSRGSIIHLWRQQMASGLPLTVTDPASTRFWLTLDDGIDLVLTAWQMMQGGEVFVPRARAATVADLMAAAAPDSPFTITGLRVNEKKHEVLVAAEEARQTVICNDCFVILPTAVTWPADWHGVGLPVPRGFEYRSNGALQRLNLAELRQMLRDVP